MKNQRKAHLAKILLTIALSLLFLLGGCTAPPDAGTPAESLKPSDQTATEPDSSEPPADAADSNERITMVTQIYEGQDIIEIPYIEYDGENPELESINTIFNQGFQMSYENYLAEKVDGMWMEMKTYPFTTDEYLQIVMTYGVYPAYGTEGNIESINYDRAARKYLTIEDALDMAGMTEDDVYDFVGKCEIPDSRGESVSDIKISGFLISGTAEDETIVLLLTLTMQTEEGNQRDGLYSYNPAIDDNWDAVTKLSNYCLFDPYDMDEMDPPLFYAREAEKPQSLTEDMVFNGEWANVETGETMLFSKEKFIQYNDSWEDNPDDTYYSFDEAEDPYNISVYMGGGISSHNYYNFDPDTQILIHYEFGEVAEEFRLK